MCTCDAGPEQSLVLFSMKLIFPPLPHIAPPNSPAASAAVLFGGIVNCYLFIVHCVGFVLGPSLVVQYIVSLFCNHLTDKERAGCFAFTVFLMFGKYNFSLPVPHGAVG